MPLGLAGFDRRAIGKAAVLVGIDEVGRGCLAGPVVAAAVRCEAAFYSTSWCRRNSRHVDDSKRLTGAMRAFVVKRFAYPCREKWIQIGIGLATVEEIERHNIYNATTLAMKRALGQVLERGPAELWGDPAGRDEPPPENVAILIDGRPIRSFPHAHEGVVKGDQRSLAIALAGIHAKEWRDARMRELACQHPCYGFEQHMGYGTQRHLQMLREHGPCPEHRPSFLRKPGKACAGEAGESQGSLFGHDSIERES
jgi:ribonuclease HII